MVKLVSRKTSFLIHSFLRHDLKASISVFFVALPLCLGISLASGAPVYSGIISGIIGGLVVSLISKSELSVSGPAAGLTAICAAAILKLGSLEVFFLSVSIAGILQILTGVVKLGGFTQFIPSSVIKGMLAAIGIILISKQIPALLGYDKPEFWSNELFNIITLDHVFSNAKSFINHIGLGPILISILSLIFLALWKRTMAYKLSFVPASFLTVLFGSLLALGFKKFLPSLSLEATQYVSLPADFFSQIKFPDFSSLFTNAEIWKTSIIIFFVASLETLLSVEAIDKLDPYNRITPQNRELIAQGTGNLFSGLIGGLPITAVIVRSSANAEAGAKSKLSAFTHGIWLLLIVLFAVSVINMVPYCILAVILIRTGYNLAKPKMIAGVFKQGREQFLPFLITVIAILFTDLLIGVLIGVVYSIYFLIKHTYRAGFVVKEKNEGSIRHFTIELALNVSFMNKKRINDMLDSIPEYSYVEILGTDSVYIDNDILEIFQNYKSKAKRKHIELHLHGIAEVQTIEIH